MATWKKIVTESSAGVISQNTTGNSATATNVAYTGLTGTVPTWNQDTTGTSAKASALARAVDIGGVSFDGSASIDLPGVNTRGSQDTTGNSATASKLASARTIGGVSFDGSANIDLPGVNTAGTQDTSGNSATATKWASGVNLSVSGDAVASAVALDGTRAVDLAVSLERNVVGEDELADAGIKVSHFNDGRNQALGNGNDGQFLTSDGSGYVKWTDQSPPNDATMTGGGAFTGNQASDSAVTLGVSATPSFTTVTTSGNVVVGGDLQVTGQTITTSTETLEIGDNKMILNSDLGSNANAVNSGFVVQRGKSGDDALLFWKESDSSWHVGTDAGGDITRATSQKIAVQSAVSTFDNTDETTPVGMMAFETSSGDMYLRTA